MPVQEPAGGFFQAVHSVAFDVEVVLLPAFKLAFEFHDGVTFSANARRQKQTMP